MSYKISKKPKVLTEDHSVFFYLKNACVESMSSTTVTAYARQN